MLDSIFKKMGLGESPGGDSPLVNNSPGTPPEETVSRPNVFKRPVMGKLKKIVRETGNKITKNLQLDGSDVFSNAIKSAYEAGKASAKKHGSTGGGKTKRKTKRKTNKTKKKN